MTTYHFHIRLEREKPERTIELVEAIRSYRDGLAVYDCLELVTEDRDLATAIQSLFQVNPDLLGEQWAGETTEDLLQALEPADLVEAERGRLLEDLPIPEEEPPSPAPPEPAEAMSVHWAGPECVQETPAPVSPMRTCVQCGKEFTPTSNRQKSCSKECAKAISNARYREKAWRNGKAIAEVVGSPDPAVHQTRKWLISRPNGGSLEVDNIGHLLDQGKLEPGQRVHKLGKGWFEVYETSPGVLGLRRAVEAAA